MDKYFEKRCKTKDIDNTKEELHTKNKKWWHFGRNVK